MKSGLSEYSVGLICNIGFGLQSYSIIILMYKFSIYIKSMILQFLQIIANEQFSEAIYIWSVLKLQELVSCFIVFRLSARFRQ